MLRSTHHGDKGRLPLPLGELASPHQGKEVQAGEEDAGTWRLSGELINGAAAVVRAGSWTPQVPKESPVSPDPGAKLSVRKG